MERQKKSIPKVYLLYAALAASAILSFLMFAHIDTDILWHYKLGEIIVNTKNVSLTDTFSWQQGLSFMKHEWLYEMFIYGLLKYTGTIGYYLINILLLTILFYGGAIYNKTQNSLLYLIMAVIGYTFTTKTVGLRPAEFSIFILIWMIAVYKKERTKKDKFIFFIFGVFLANFHGGTILTAAVLMLLYFVLGLFMDFRDVVPDMIFLWKNRKRTNDLSDSEKSSLSKVKDFINTEGSIILQALLPIICFIAGTLLNPYGYHLWEVAFIGPFAETTSAIAEWQATSFSYVSGFFLLLMVLSFGYHMAKHGINKKDIQMFALICALGVLGMTSRRCCSLYLYFWLFFGYQATEELIFDILGKIPMFKWRTGVLASGLFTCFFLSIIYKTFDVPVDFADFIMKDKSSAIFEILKENPESRILHGYTSGNYLVFNDIKCFVDSRQHPFIKEMGNGSLDDLLYISKDNDHEKVYEFLEKYEFEYIYISEDFDIRWYLEKQDQYQLIYEDEITNEQLWQIVSK